jgi:uncharacterized protein YndB with AHSA1/START domain
MLTDGRLEALDDGRWQLRFVRELSHAPEKVWRALVEPQHLAAWMPARMEGERREGAPLRFVFPEEPSYESLGEMRVFEPPSLLEYSWEDEVLRFELRPTERGCELTFLTRFEEVGKASRDAAGWHVCLDQLEAHLDGVEPDWKAEDRWRPLNARYRELFGPEASTIGPPEWHPESRGEEWSRELARDHSVTVRQTFEATPSSLYAAWTDPALMRRWMGVRVEADVRPGGAYRREIEMDGERWVHAGEYVSLDSDRRIVQTFRVETSGDNPFRDEIVEVRLRPLGGGRTELALTEAWNGPELTAAQERESSESWAKWLAGLEPVLEQRT